MRNVLKRKILIEVIIILTALGAASLAAAQWFKAEHTTSASCLSASGLGLLAFAFALFLVLLFQLFSRPRELLLLNPHKKAVTDAELSNLSANRFTDFEIIRDSGLVLEFEIWYEYNGALGNDNISIGITPVNNGQRLRGGAGYSGHEIHVVGHKALARIHYTYQSSASEGASKSTHLELTMHRWYPGDVVFHRQLFPYVKTWPKKSN